MRRSFFFRNYIAHAILILFVFSAAGGVFSRQLSRFAYSEKQSQLKATAQTVADQTGFVLENDEMYTIYKPYLARTAQSEEVTILLTDAEGKVLLRADPDDGEKLSHVPENAAVDQMAVQQVRQNGFFTGVGTLGGILGSGSYIFGAPCTTADGEIAAIVFASATNELTVGMIEGVSRSFMMILLGALSAALVLSYFISASMTQPLKTMARAAKEYAAGNFDVRVPEDNKCDEIDELAVSFNNMARDLEQLDDLTKSFIGNVSHEFKTPMTTIGGFVDGMLDGTIPLEQHEKYLKVISEEVGRLSRMVMRMLDAAKIQSGELILSSAPFDFTEMSSQIILSFEQKINQKHLDVDIDFDDRIIVMGDRDHVFRAVYNLVDNAVKFVNEGGKLTLRAHEAGKYCEFSIKNTGAGIAPEDIPHVFDRFYKTDRSRSLDRSGAGLGLYIVKNIINLHGGDISVRSDGGETEFSLILPLAQKK